VDTVSVRRVASDTVASTSTGIVDVFVIVRSASAGEFKDSSQELNPPPASFSTSGVEPTRADSDPLGPWSATNARGADSKVRASVTVSPGEIDRLPANTKAYASPGASDGALTAEPVDVAGDGDVRPVSADGMTATGVPAGEPVDADGIATDAQPASTAIDPIARHCFRRMTPSPYDPRVR
jgi:hypothetical protein